MQAFQLHTQNLLAKLLASQPPYHSSKPGGNSLLDEIYQNILNVSCQIIDQRHGIQSCITKVNGEEVWVRTIDYPAQQRISPEQNSSINYHYLRMFYTYLCAALTLVEIENAACEDFNSELRAFKLRAEKSISEKIDSQTFSTESLTKLLAEEKGALIALIKKYMPNADPLQINNQLDQAKNWVALEKPTLPVVTIIKNHPQLANKTVMIVDTPCTRLTEEQLKEFQNMGQQRWYQEASPFERKLLTHYRPRILAQNSVVPSQLRATVPAGKNAFNESVWIADDDEIELLNEYYHSGTAAFLSHKDEETARVATRNNLCQQKLNSNTDAVVMINLNSSIADWVIAPYEHIRGNQYNPDDSKIIQLSWQAAASLAEQNIFVTKICLNSFRYIEFNDYSGINALIAIVIANLKLLDPGCAQVKNLQQHIHKLHKLQFQPYDGDVKGLDIIYLLTQIARLNNQLAAEHSTSQLKTVAVWFGCASGQNRTGITYYNTICQSLLDYIQRDTHAAPSAAVRKSIHDMVAQSQHVPNMTDHGGTFGVAGIRSKSRYSFKRDQPTRLLVSKYADIKVLPAEDHSFNQELLYLEAALQRNKNEAWLANIWYWARKFAAHARRHQNTAAMMTQQHKRIYASAMHVVAELLDNPADSVAYATLNANLNELKKSQEFAGKNQRNYLLTGTGILIGCLGAVITTLAVISLFSTFGASSVLSFSGIAIGSLLITKACCLTGTAALATGATVCGGLIASRGLFHHQCGAIDYIKKIKQCSRSHQESDIESRLLAC